ncbi:MAG: hypothetical protein U5K70_02400 [Halodesulfurarchaeum sp.]|nr:hypothetical protein [Halodesulfurarchaeum sp.]
MDDRTKASLLWGLAGGLAFLVLVQTSRLFAALELGLPRLVPVAVAVFAATAGLGWLVEGRLARKRQV